MPWLSSTAVDSAAPAEDGRVSPRRLLLAALLSTLLPGAGHFLVRRYGKALLLLLILGVWFVAYCWLRLPQTAYGAILPILALAGLCVFGAWDVAYSGGRPEPKPSQWWLAAFLPLALYAGSAWGSLALRTAGFQVFSIPAASMAPAIPEGSRVVADRRYYVNRKIRHGEIIIFVSAMDPQLLVAKRVIAVGGEKIQVEGETVLINGERISEPYAVFKGSSRDLPSVGPTILPADRLFVMGDNRNVSFDSRYEEFGLVDVNEVRGKVIYRLSTINTDLTRFD
jgi:signal peptidase I